MRLNELAKELELSSDTPEYQQLKSDLDDLVEQKKITKSTRRRYALPDQKPDEPKKLQGIFQHEYNISFFYPDDDSKKIRVKFADTHTALHGDKVAVKIQGSGKKATAKVIEVIQRAKHKMIGHIESDGLDYYFVSDDNHYHIDFLVKGADLDEILPLQKVTVEFIRWEDIRYNPEVVLSGVYSDEDKIRSLFEDVMNEFNLKASFPSEVQADADLKGTPEGPVDKPERMDIRDLDVITIDPADARDFDDALSLETLENGNFRVGIHIADVSTYIPENSKLDIEARKRGNSVYLVDKVVPMLPEHISNIVCSLNPHVDRNAFSVFVELTKLCRIVDYEISETLINSKRRFSYEEAQEVLDSGEGDFADTLASLNNLAMKMRKKRFKTGGIEFETTETRYRTDENGYPALAELKSPTASTKLIEEFMLLANRVVAKFVDDISKKRKAKNTYPYLFRIHEQPEPEMLRTNLEFVTRIGGEKHDKKNISSAEINRILRSFEGRPEKSIVNAILIRSMPKAVYSQINMGHYGLGFKDYSHFTSPIRRYPDLIIHRLIKEYLKEAPDSGRVAYLKKLVKEVGAHCSATERTAMEAERASKKVAGAILAYDNMNREFGGTVTGVMQFGIFVQLDTLLCEGLIHIRELKDDYYTYDENNFMLRGKKKKNRFRIGDRLNARITRVVLAKRQIDLAFIGRIEDVNE
jgi:ribonuclease R